MNTEPLLTDITHTIQLAVAPVFLLTAVSTTLSVFSLRLARIVDRARRVEASLAAATPVHHEAIRVELGVLHARARLIHLALTFGTGCAIMVCLVIAVAFVGYLLEAHVGVGLAILFILALGAYVVALLCYLREVFMAIAHLRFGPGPASAAPPAAPHGPAA
jgi:hypothetical protein